MSFVCIYSTDWQGPAVVTKLDALTDFFFTSIMMYGLQESLVLTGKFTIRNDGEKMNFKGNSDQKEEKKNVFSWFFFFFLVIIHRVGLPLGMNNSLNGYFSTFYFLFNLLEFDFSFFIKTSIRVTKDVMHFNPVDTSSSSYYIGLLSKFITLNLYLLLFWLPNAPFSWFSSSKPGSPFLTFLTCDFWIWGFLRTWFWPFFLSLISP